MRITSSLSLASLGIIPALSLSVLANPVPPWAAVSPDGHPARIAVHAPQDPTITHLSWPKAIRTAAGTVVLAYSAGIAHNQGGSGPAISVSNDNGKTFSPPHVLMRFPDDDPRYRDCGNLALGLTDDGAILLLAMAFSRGPPRDNRVLGSNIYGWRSDDDGVTWTRTDTSALGPDKTGSVFGYILAIPGQGLAAFGHYRAGSNPHTQGVWMSLSADHGTTWGDPRRIADIHGVEPVVVRSGGRLVGFFRGRSAVPDGRMYIGVSDDLGHTWKTQLSDLTSDDTSETKIAAPFAVENPNRPGEILALTTERIGRPTEDVQARGPGVPGDSNAARGLVWLWRGNAQTLEWTRDRILLEKPYVKGDPHNDFGYTWMLHSGGNRWQLYYYHGHRLGSAHIWVTDVEL